MKKLLITTITIITILISINVYASGPPCPPFSPCWCQQNPTHPKCTQVGVPINDGIGYLALSGILLAIFYYKKIKHP